MSEANVAMSGVVDALPARRGPEWVVVPVRVTPVARKREPFTAAVVVTAPRLADRVLSSVQPGDRVTVTGRLGPLGDDVAVYVASFATAVGDVDDYPGLLSGRGDARCALSATATCAPTGDPVAFNVMVNPTLAGDRSRPFLLGVVARHEGLDANVAEFVMPRVRVVVQGRLAPGSDGLVVEADCVGVDLRTVAGRETRTLAG